MILPIRRSSIALLAAAAFALVTSGCSSVEPTQNSPDAAAAQPAPPAPTPAPPAPPPPSPPPPAPVAKPTIAGSSASQVMVGQAYTFTPTASTSNSGPLQFSVTGRPAWASFSTSTGRLAGTPSAADVGEYSVTITVRDAVESASLSFRITVAQVATGRATISWSAPATRTDGTPLTNLAAFRVYYGTSAGALTRRLDITNPTVTTAVVENLTPGTWHFAATAVDATGLESQFSGTASKTIG